MLVVYVALQGPAAVNKRLSNRGVLAGKRLHVPFVGQEIIFQFFVVET